MPVYVFTVYYAYGIYSRKEPHRVMTIDCFSPMYSVERRYVHCITEAEPCYSARTIMLADPLSK